jgi:hypothetical protein
MLCGWLLKFTDTFEFWLNSKDQPERINSVVVYVPMCPAEMRKICGHKSNSNEVTWKGEAVPCQMQLYVDITVFRIISYVYC